LTSVKACILARRQLHEEAEAAISHAVEIGKGFGHFHHTAHNIASAYAAMGRPNEAIDWLENAADEGFPNYTYFKVDPNLDPVREHPRFTDLMSRLEKQWIRFKEIAADPPN
ncbi:MAG: tetratricopeptide repeat protein, partial [bacterium]|nr:tetratricopeptide repeat protein [bacterium]